MANQGAKKRKEENARHVRNLLRVIIFCNNGDGEGTMRTFQEMISAGLQPDSVSLINILTSCSHRGLVEEGMWHFNNMTETYHIELRREHYATMVLYIVVRMMLYYSSFTWKHWIGLMVTSVAYTIPYKQLASMAEPSYSDNGELIDGGFDMSTGGICGYLHDVIYITCFVQIASLISDKFWYTYLVIPGFAAYKFSGLLKGFMSPGSEEGEEDEKTRKKREKMERKASRPKFMKTRNR